MSQRERLAAVLSNMHHGMVMYDCSENIVVINRHVSTIFGFPEEAVPIGSTLSEYLQRVGIAVGWSPARVAGVIDNHRKWAQQGVTVRLDHHFDDGRVFEICFNPVEEGGAILTFADVTQDRRMRAISERRGRLIEETAAMLDEAARISSRNRFVALNASMEAARMGHDGAGFAVVADEFRELCRHTSDLLAEMSRVLNAVTTED